MALYWGKKKHPKYCLCFVLASDWRPQATAVYVCIYSRQLLYICASVCVCVCRLHTCDQKIFLTPCCQLVLHCTNHTSPHKLTKILHDEVAWVVPIQNISSVKLAQTWRGQWDKNWRRGEVEASFKLGNNTNEHLAVKCRPHNKEPSFVYIQHL